MDRLERLNLVKESLCKWLLFSGKKKLQVINAEAKIKAADNYITDQELKEDLSWLGRELRKIEIEPRPPLKKEVKNEQEHGEQRATEDRGKQGYGD